MRRSEHSLCNVHAESENMMNIILITLGVVFVAFLALIFVLRQIDVYEERKFIADIERRAESIKQILREREKLDESIHRRRMGR